MCNNEQKPSDIKQMTFVSPFIKKDISCFNTGKEIIYLGEISPLLEDDHQGKEIIYLGVISPLFQDKQQSDMIYFFSFLKTNNDNNWTLGTSFMFSSNPSQRRSIGFGILRPMLAIKHHARAGYQ